MYKYTKNFRSPRTGASYSNKPFRPSGGGTFRKSKQYSGNSFSSKTSYNSRFNSNPRYNNNSGSNGRNTKSFRDINVFVKKANNVSPVPESTALKSFDDFVLSNPLKENIKSKGYEIPTPIQEQAINPILEGRDLIGLANTGTGKTGAFLIPIIDNIFKFRDRKALIIVPTRELALQIQDELRSLALGMKIYSALLIGGTNIGRQIFDIRRNPHVVIATPGRLKDLVKRSIVHLDEFKIIVLDEVDLMVDIGFISDVKFFVQLLPKTRQSLFFSATISPKIQDILASFVNNPVTVSIKAAANSENIDQDIVRVSDKNKKVDLLHDLLIKDGFDKVLIFGRTKHGVEKLSDELVTRGFKAGAIHGNKTQGNRRRTLDSFKRNEISILLATDVASRGLDIDNVTHVINYDLPQTYEDYIHRIGRTGRAGKTGTALTFVE